MTSSRSPRPTSKVTSANTSSAPNDLYSSVAVSTVRPADGGSGNRTASARRFAVFFTRLASSLARRPSRFLATARPLGGLAAHAAGLRLEPRDLARLAFGQLRGAFLVAFARREVLRVRALVLDERAGALLRLAVDVHHAGDRLVEEIEVVAHDEQRAAVRPQELEQPGAGVGVEVVRGLVEQEQLAAAEEDAHELGAAPLAAGQRAEVEVEAIGAADRRPSASLRTSASAAYPPAASNCLLRGAEALDVLGRRGSPRARSAASRCGRGDRRARGPRTRGRGRWCRRGRRRCGGPATGSR